MASTALAVQPSTAAARRDRKAARLFAERATSPATRRAYRTCWTAFVQYCEDRDASPLPADPFVVADFLASTPSLASSTLRVRLAAIAFVHRRQGLPSPSAHPAPRETLAGIIRSAPPRPPRQAKALTARDLQGIRTAARIHPGLTPAARRRALKDVAIAAVLRDALLRRSEAAALRWQDVSFRSDGTARVTVRRSKTDQLGEGAVLFIGKDAALDLMRLREEDAPEETARVFGYRTGRSISNRLKAAAKRAGLEGSFSGHSGRVGMARDLVGAGFSIAQLQVAGRWASPTMPASYARSELAGQGAVARYYS